MRVLLVFQKVVIDIEQNEANATALTIEAAKNIILLASSNWLVGTAQSQFSRLAAGLSFSAFVFCACIEYAIATTAATPMHSIRRGMLGQMHCTKHTSPQSSCCGIDESAMNPQEQQLQEQQLLQPVDTYVIEP